MGRPQSYALDSLLTGGNTGVWHLTIGNPLKPIITIGNLEVTNTEIQHLGPLGIDDFPTELKVTISFKHARPRDAVDIEKMYMFGDRSIYKTHVRSNPGKIYTVFKDNNIDKEVAADDNYAASMSDAVQKQAATDQKTAAQAAKAEKDGNSDNKSKTSDKKTEAQERQRQEPLPEPSYGFEETQESKKAYVASVGTQKDEDGLDYIGEFDVYRKKANMNELS